MSDGHNKRLTNLEREVARLHKAIAALREQHITSQGKQEQTHQQGNSTSVPTFIERAPNPPNHASDAAQRSNPVLNGAKWIGKFIRTIRWRATLEVLGLIAGVVYAWVTYRQWRDLQHNFVIDERAYLSIRDGAIDWDEHGINYTMENFGHLPTGPVTIVSHTALVDIKSDGPVNVRKDAIEHYWTRRIRQSIDPHVPIHGGGTSLRKFDPALIVTGRQGVILSGMATYNDGFSGGDGQRVSFCYQSSVQTYTKQFRLQSCDPEAMLRAMTELDKDTPEHGR